jgi:hypothetical protein
MEGRVEVTLVYRKKQYNIEFFTENESVHIKKDQALFQIIDLPTLKDRSVLNSTKGNLYFCIYDALTSVTEKVDELMSKHS